MRRFLAAVLGLQPKRPHGHPPKVFNDLDGIQYYGWENPAELPPKRFAQVQDVMRQIDAGMSAKTLREIAEAQMEQLGIAQRSKTPKERDIAIQRAGFLANELLVRPQRIIPEDCFYSLAAMCVVRHDEDPYTFDVGIHREKMAAFQLAGRAGHAFFTVGLLTTLLGRSNTSTSGLMQLRASWRAQEARTQAVWNVFRGKSDDDGA